MQSVVTELGEKSKVPREMQAVNLSGMELFGMPLLQIFCSADFVAKSGYVRGQ